MAEELSCDIVYHLVGEQAIPVFLTAIQFPETTRHCLLTTDVAKTKAAVEAIAATLLAKGRSVEIHYLGGEEIAVSFSDLIPRMREILAETNPENLSAGFDITGGTKPMSISLMIAARELREENIFYLDSRGKQLLCLTDYARSRELHNRMELEDFIHLGGMELQSACTECVSSGFLNFLYQKSGKMQKYQEIFARCLPKQKNPNPQKQFLDTYPKFKQEIGESTWNKFVPELNDPSGRGPSWTALAKFLAGEWFEQYVFDRLKQRGSGITDIRRDLVLSFTDAGSGRSAQEFDVAYTDGFSLILLECKAGKVSQEHINKLENLRGKYSGTLGRSALVTLNPSETKNGNKEFFSERVRKSRAIAAFCGKNGIQLLPRNLFDFEVGTIYE